MNLNDHNIRKQLASDIKNKINKWCEETYNDGHRNHLGASLMGESCNRKLWYTFRWVFNKVHDGRIQRLFQVGHEAEHRFIKYLENVGITVVSRTEDDKQHRVSAHNNHFGGSLDGLCYFTENDESPLLAEFKTNGTGAGFNNVELLGMEKAKPKHWAQVCIYGFLREIEYCLYMIENKNDSDITIQILKLDLEYGKKLVAKAGWIIEQQTPPERISSNPAYFECSFCDFKDICHYKGDVEINCRSCREAKPVENAQWNCGKFGLIPSDYVKQGCSEHVSINGE